jgi:hypothetical protein
MKILFLITLTGYMWVQGLTTLMHLGLYDKPFVPTLCMYKQHDITILTFIIYLLSLQFVTLNHRRNRGGYIVHSQHDLQMNKIEL